MPDDPTGPYRPATRLTDPPTPPGDSTGPMEGAGVVIDAPPEDLIAGRFRVIDEIARGGMGAVYRATDTAFDREVAVKVLQRKLIGSTAAARFYAEAAITARLQHPGIPPVHAVGELADGRPFLAMKLIRGRTFADVLRDREALATDLDRDLQTFEQVCLAVAYAHSRGVVHRDLKPANVMVGAFGEVQVMDWGLAKKLRAAEPARRADDTGADYLVADSELTAAGAVMGTLAYMPPEQARGKSDKVDLPADVFSLGAILCVILTGKPPYLGPSAATVFDKALAGNTTEAFLRLDRCPAAHKSAAMEKLIALCKRCLAANPAARPSHAGELAVAVALCHQSAGQLEKLAETRLAVEAYSTRIDETTTAAARARRWGIVMVQLGLFTTLVAGAVAYWGYTKEVARQETATAAAREARRAERAEPARAVLLALPHLPPSDRKSAALAADKLVDALPPDGEFAARVALFGHLTDANDRDRAEANWQAAVRLAPRVRGADGTLDDPTDAAILAAEQVVRADNPTAADKAVLRKALERLDPLAVTADIPAPARKRATAAADRAKAALAR